MFCLSTLGMILKKALLSVVCLCPAPFALVLFAGVCTGSKAARETISTIQGSEPHDTGREELQRKGPGDFTQKQIILVTLFL